MKEKEFYEMLSEIHNAVADMSDGCMGCKYTPERVKLNDTHSQDYSKCQQKVGEEMRHPTYVPSDRTLDYLGNIIRKHIEVN